MFAAYLSSTISAKATWFGDSESTLVGTLRGGLSGKNYDVAYMQ
tara:strand:- start:1635 stop:1766 length:132 start_codon:yes stop_codon:yes gene_type:complete